jgi:acetyltransferase-like isoleucine patch superfamily enzyme
MLLDVFRNGRECIMSWLREALHRAQLQGSHPTCRIYPGITMDRHSRLGNYNVLFEDVTIVRSAIDDHTYVQRGSIISHAEVGKFCSIAPGVCVGVSQHSIAGVSSHPAFYLRNTPLAKVYCEQDRFVTSRMTIVGHDVWIGQNAIVLGGLKIGVGAVIGAGAVVTRDVPPYAVVGGVPAEIIKYRFDEVVRRALLASNWWSQSDQWLQNNWHLFQEPDEMLKSLSREQKAGTE